MHRRQAWSNCFFNSTYFHQYLRTNRTCIVQPATCAWCVCKVRSIHHLVVELSSCGDRKESSPSLSHQKSSSYNIGGIKSDRKLSLRCDRAVALHFHLSLSTIFSFQPQSVIMSIVLDNAYKLIFRSKNAGYPRKEHLFHWNFLN